MKNWIRIGNRYINLDQIVDIITDETRANTKLEYQSSRCDDDGNYVPGGFPPQPCVIFVRPVTEGEYSSLSSEIIFFGEERERILAWLANDVEMEITNLNFSDMEPAK